MAYAIDLIQIDPNTKFSLTASNLTPAINIRLRSLSLLYRYTVTLGAVSCGGGGDRSRGRAEQHPPGPEALVSGS